MSSALGLAELIIRSFSPTFTDPSDEGLYSGAGTLEEASHEIFSIEPEVSVVHLAITLLSLFITFFGLYSGFIKERLFVGEAIIATVFGIAFSTYAGGLFTPRTWASGERTYDITLEFTRVIIALSVFAVGVELPRAYILRHWRSMAMLLGPVMLIGWMVAASLLYAIIPGLEFLPALVVAAGVTPTDPILASSVVGKGKFAQEHVPAHIRHVLQCESGCNDGAAFPFLYLALFLLLREHHSVGNTIGWWICLVILYQIILGCFIGAIVGVVARKLLKFSKRRELIDRESMVAMYVALALLVTGLTTLAGSDDLLAAFACGTAFAWDDWFTESIEESNFSSTIDLLANSMVFVYLGATMPFSAWNDPDGTTLTPWRLVLVAIGVLALRRLPTIFALQWWIPDIKTRREAIFVGHFGPMGVGAIFISTLAATKLPTPSIPPENAIDVLALSVQPITYFIVLSSILIHGLTISFFSLGRRVHSRVASMSRTFTNASSMSRNGGGRGGVLGSAKRAFGKAAGTNAKVDRPEPSWMSRVKMARNAEDIVVNRDDDPLDRTEKGHGTGSGSNTSSTMTNSADGPDREKDIAEEYDLDPEHVQSEEPSTVAMPGSKLAAARREHKERSHSRDRKREAEAEREEEEHPKHNVLASGDDNDEARKRDAEHREERRRGKGVEHDKEGHEQERKGLAPRSRSPSPEGREGQWEEEGVRRRKKSGYKEARYCKPGQQKQWREGNKIIIDHGDGGEVDVIEINPSADATRKAKAHPTRKVVDVPEGALEAELGPGARRTTEQQEKSAAAKVAQKVLGGASAAAILGVEKLTPEQRAEKERKRKDKLKRDDWCRREKHYHDEDQGKHAKQKEWIEGDKVVVEKPDGTIKVRELTGQEKERRAAKHLAALYALGHPLEAVQDKLQELMKQTSRESDLEPQRAAATPGTPRKEGEDYFGQPIEGYDKGKDKGKGKAEAGTTTRSAPSSAPSSVPPSRAASRTPSPEPRFRKTGLSLERTDRVYGGSDDDEADGSDGTRSDHDEARRSRPGRSSSSTSPRPPPTRAGSSSRLQSVIQGVFKPKQGRAASNSPNPGASAGLAGPAGRGRAGLSRRVVTEEPEEMEVPEARGIRFAAVEKPDRAGTTGSGRALPVVGGGLSLRREPTNPGEGLSLQKTRTIPKP